MSSSNRLRNIAIVGAGGHSGSYMTQELLKTGLHQISAISRHDSTSDIPEGVAVVKVDYNDHASLARALENQDALIITMGTRAPPDTQTKLIEAAATAKVPWILPNEWSPDTASDGLVKDVFAFQTKPKAREHIRRLGVSSYIAVTTGFWYEWSLAIEDAFGFNFAKRSATFFDQGDTLTNISTWPQVGRAVAALASLPIRREIAGKSQGPCLEDFKNRQIYVSSFLISQKDMFDSVLRVTQTDAADWEIKHEDVRKRYAEGVERFARGDRLGFARLMYSRVFFPDDLGNFEKRIGTVNGVLGLPEDDLDAATERAIQRSKETSWE